MKAWMEQLVTLGILGLAGAAAVCIGNFWLRSLAADRYEQSAHHDKCAKARVTFFEECLMYDRRPRCEEMWSNKRGLVFDYPPETTWADEIDCSKEIK